MLSLDQGPEPIGQRVAGGDQEVNGSARDLLVAAPTPDSMPAAPAPSAQARTRPADQLAAGMPADEQLAPLDVLLSPGMASNLGNAALLRLLNPGTAGTRSAAPPAPGTTAAPGAPVTTRAEPSTSGPLTAAVLAAISADAARLTREVVSTFPNRTRILDVFDTWDRRDRAVPGSSGDTAPHVDALCAALQARQLSAATTALDMVWHVAHSSTSGQLFDSLVARSSRYRGFQPGPPLRSFWQLEAKEADRLRLLVLAGQYDEVQRRLSAVFDPTNRDDISVELVTYLDDATLVSMGGSAPGRDLLERLYDELMAGKVGADEQAQAKRIQTARTATVTPEMYQKAVTSRDLRVFPYRKGGFSASAAIPWASFTGDGQIFVRMNMNVRTNPAFDQDTRTLPLEAFTAKGMVLPADQIVGVRFYDEGGSVEYVPAMRLVALKHEGVTHTFEKMGEVAGLALGVVGGGVEAVGLGARVLLWADRAAVVLGVLGSVISEHRGWFIQQYGESGRQFVEAVEMVNSAVALFGIIRVATSLPKLVSGLRQGLRGLRKPAAGVARDLTVEEQDVLRTATTQADDLATKLEDIQQAKAPASSVKGAEPGMAATPEPATPTGPGPAKKGWEEFLPQARERVQTTRREYAPSGQVLRGMGKREKAIAFINTDYMVDMTGFSGGRTATGSPRNSRAFWTELLDTHPELFSPKNAKFIRKGRAPRVDALWCKFHPNHSLFDKSILVHHHIEQGWFAVGIPEPVHHLYYPELHPVTNPSVLE
jgi:hypothetical protein